MSNLADIFSEARRVFERLPGPAMMAFALGKLAEADVERQAMRGWALDITAEFGVLSYVRPSLDRLLAEAERQRPEQEQAA
jgi:hypothetical protein